MQELTMRDDGRLASVHPDRPAYLTEGLRLRPSAFRQLVDSFPFPKGAPT
jgi:hypothetical protein